MKIGSKESWGLMKVADQEKDYRKEIADLANGKLDQLVITPDQFAAFQRAYHSSPSASRIEGLAQHNGKIIYRAKQ